MTPSANTPGSATALLDRHPAPAVQIRGLPPAPKDTAGEVPDADALCQAIHFVPRWWPGSGAR